MAGYSGTAYRKGQQQLWPVLPFNPTGPYSTLGLLSPSRFELGEGEVRLVRYPGDVTLEARLRSGSAAQRAAPSRQTRLPPRETQAFSPATQSGEKVFPR